MPKETKGREAKRDRQREGTYYVGETTFLKTSQPTHFKKEVNSHFHHILIQSLVYKRCCFFPVFVLIELSTSPLVQIFSQKSPIF